MAPPMDSGGSSPMPPPTTTPQQTAKRKICVYCGSSPGTKPEHMEAARELARVMAANDIGLGRSPAHRRRGRTCGVPGN